jgi:aminoglycoside phosphotransferase family enzyme
MQAAAGGYELPSLAEKVAFLSSPAVYGRSDVTVTCRETHMSWVFLVAGKAYKLKKPAHLPYLDFSTLAHREAACRAELRLNRRLALDVYERVVPLAWSPQGLSIEGEGEVVDWLVVMRRLDERDTLEHAILTRQLTAWQLDRLVATLTQFYRRAAAALVSPAVHLAGWHHGLAYNRSILLRPDLGLPSGQVRRIDQAQRLFLAERSALLVERVRRRHIVDGHGDLRPEHIWLGDPVRIIDCLEFNPRLRTVDPFDEVAFLCVECERLGAPWAAQYIRRRMAYALRDGLSDALFAFYRCHRATLRARLAIAHLIEPAPRTPEKWPRLARRYLDIAAGDALRLQRLVRTPRGR